MRPFLKCLILMIPIFFVCACGSGSDSTSTVTSEQTNNISAALTGTMNATDYNSFAAPASIDINSGIISDIVKINSNTVTCNTTTLSCTGTPSGTYACAGGGHITYSGNLTVACTEVTHTVVNNVDIYTCTGNWYTALSLVFQVSDPTNNLNDCDVGNGVILDGTVNFTASGTNEAISANMNGTIGINERGPTGGLVPITSDCYIFVSFPHGGSASGTICGNSVSN